MGPAKKTDYDADRANYLRRLLRASLANLQPGRRETVRERMNRGSTRGGAIRHDVEREVAHDQESNRQRNTEHSNEHRRHDRNEERIVVRPRPAPNESYLQDLLSSKLRKLKVGKEGPGDRGERRQDDGGKTRREHNGQHGQHGKERRQEERGERSKRHNDGVVERGERSKKQSDDMERGERSKTPKAKSPPPRLVRHGDRRPRPQTDSESELSADELGGAGPSGAGPTNRNKRRSTRASPVTGRRAGARRASPRLRYRTPPRHDRHDDDGTPAKSPRIIYRSPIKVDRGRRTKKRATKIKKSPAKRPRAFDMEMPKMVTNSDLDQEGRVATGNVGNMSFTVKQVSDRRLKSLRIDQRNFDLEFHPREDRRDRPLRLFDVIDTVYVAVQAMHDFICQQYRHAQYADIQLVVVSDHLEPNLHMNKCPLHSPDCINLLIHNMENLLNSKRNIPMDQSFKILTVVTNVPPVRVGAGEKSNNNKKKQKKQLGAAFSNPELFKNKWLQFPPELDGDLQDTCLLSSLVIGLKYNRELEAYSGFEFMNRPMTPAWRKLTYLKSENKKKRDKGRGALLCYIRDFLEEHKLDAKEFRLARLDDLRPTFDRINVNIRVFSKESGCQMVFSHPRWHDPARPTVNILTMRNVVRNSMHAGVIKRMCKFFASNQRRVCEFCNVIYSTRHFNQHRCTQREICKQCKYKLAKEGDYVNYDILQERCLSEIKPEMEATMCNRCFAKCWTAKCLEEHVKLCQKRERCEDCLQVYKVGVKDYTHRCGDTMCNQCFRRYNRHLDPPHHCELLPPGEQKKYQLIAVWDTETFTDKKKRHICNAVGLSFEDRNNPGRFSERYFYDAAMEHPESGILRENTFEFDYLPDRLKELNKKKIKKKKKNKDGEVVEVEVEESIYVKIPERFRDLVPGPRGKVVDRDQQEEEEVLGVAIGTEEEADPRRLARQFISSEAAEDRCADEDEEEEEEEEGGEDDSEADWLDVEDDDDAGDEDERQRADGEQQVADGADSADRPQRQYPNMAWKEFKNPRADPEEDEIRSSAMEQFVDAVVNKNFYGYAFIAHNSSRFDNILLMRSLVRREIEIMPIYEGCRLLYIRLPKYKITFLDSYRYLKIPLANFPARFPGLSEARKGHFPYTFSSPKVYSYCGEIPPLDYYVDKSMPQAKVTEIEEYHAQFAESGELWDYKQQLHQYLVDDVRLLRGGCTRLLKEFFDFQEEQEHEVEKPLHCFTRPYFTASSFAHALFRLYALQPGMVYLVSNQCNARKTSKHELEWLSFVAHNEDKDIRTAFSHGQGQKRIGNYYVDGYDEESNTVLEFNGCTFHGHLLDDKDCPLSRGLTAASKGPFGGTLQELNDHWKCKLDALRQDGYNVRLMWECCYHQMREEEETLKEWLDEFYTERPHERLRLRDGLRGGRTEAFRLLYDKDVSKGRRCIYMDINSLYPAMAIYKLFPVGLPTRYIGKELDKIELHPEKGYIMRDTQKPVWGLVQARVLAPDSLFLPVLPCTSNGRMVFGLCRSCMAEERQDLCNHSDKERALEGTWTTVEMEYAVECGYKIVETFETFLYDEAEPIFKKYYTSLARMKLESEGYPSNVTTPEARQEYVDSLNREMEGLNLDPERVVANKSRRQFAKDMSNIGLGKLSQMDTRTSTSYATSWQAISELKYSETDEVVSIMPISTHVAEVKHVKKESRVGLHRNVQPVIYSFITSYSRIRLMSDMRELMKMGARIHYCDTDSVIFDIDETVDMDELKKKFRLGSTGYGCYKFETEGWLEHLVCCGPKNYAFTAEGGENSVKVRGFTLKSRAALDKLNIQTMTDLLKSWVLDQESKVIELSMFSMKTNRLEQSITNMEIVKKYRNDGFAKRFLPIRPGQESMLDECFTSFPFGAKSLDFADQPTSSQSEKHGAT